MNLLSVKALMSSSSAAAQIRAYLIYAKPHVFSAGRKVAPNVRAMVVPGSQEIKRQAEAEGLHKIFTDAGAEWRESGCSMCIAMNGDEIKAGQYAVSTSNRNFEGRQGKGGRSLLASPLTAAAAAVTGKITDVRTLLGLRNDANVSMECSRLCKKLKYSAAMGA